jgi:iron complex outermembrane receptor protein
MSFHAVVTRRTVEGVGRARFSVALLVTVFGPGLVLPVSIQAIAPASPVVMQQVQDTIPLAPIEVRVLRTPLLQNTAPLAVSALTEDDLQRGRSGFFLEEAIRGLPGVQVQNRFNPAIGERVAIRGFGARAQFGLRGIRVVVDGIPATLPDGQSSLDHLDIGSLGRVEAIRGPASALFGNASGGVLSFTTRDPANVPYEMEVMGVGGSDGLWRGQLTASGTVEDTGYLIAFSGQTWDGYRTVPEHARLDETPGTIFGGADRLGLNVRVTRQLAGGELSITANVLDLEATNPGSTTNDLRSDPTDRKVHWFYPHFDTGKTLEQKQAGVRWTGSLGSALEGDFSAYGVNRTINNPIPFDIIDLSRKGGGVRAQLGSTISTGIGDLQWRSGVEVDLQRDERSEIEATFGTGQPLPGAMPFLDQSEDVTSKGVFLQGTLELPGGAVALAGLRYDSHDFTADDHVPVTAGSPDDSGSRDMNAFSPSVGFSVPAGETVNVFGSISTIFQTPTTSELSNQPNAAGGFNPNLDPMSGESFELGIRRRIGSGAAFEVTGYQTNLQNELVPFEVAGSEGVTYFRNAGASRHRGIEATVSVAPGSGTVRGDLTYTYINARFTDYNLDGDDLSDNRIPGVGPQRVQGALRFSQGVWWTDVIGTYVDNVPVNDRNTTSAPSYFLVDLRVGLQELDLGGISVSPWVALSNALDKDYVASVAVNAFGGRFFEPGPDRSFQVGLRTRFGGGN